MGMFGIAGAAFASAISNISTWLKNKYVDSKELPSLEKLLEIAGKDNWMEYKDIETISITSKTFGGFSTELRGKQKTILFTYIAIPSEFKSQQKAKGQNGKQIKEAFHENLATIFKECTGIACEKKKGLI